MRPEEAYKKIVCTTNNIYAKEDKNNKFLKRIYKKSRKHRYFRVPEYEQYIIKNVAICYMYAKNIVHGKLPENMHNLMLCEAIANPENDYIKAYFKICKNDFDYPELTLTTKNLLSR